MKTLRLHITGKVQGVWYRASSKDKALTLGLTGQVWNQQDGSVGVLVQGPMDNLLAFVEWCREGPPLANVENVVLSEEANDEVFASFEITKG
jgi:acylphosphatase